MHSNALIHVHEGPVNYYYYYYYYYYYSNKSKQAGSEQVRDYIPNSKYTI